VRSSRLMHFNLAPSNSFRYRRGGDVREFQAMSTMPTLPADPSADILRWQRSPLDSIFQPKSVAVIGANERPGSVGRTVLANLTNGSYGGKVFPINPGRAQVLGLPTWPRIMDVPGKVDLAVIVTPAATVPAVIRDCVAARVGGAVVISAGFREIGASGKELEAQIQGAIGGSGMRIIGPNCLGVMNPMLGLNASFAQDAPLRGSVAFLSQSGALCTAILDWSRQENVGFSGFVSTGSMLDTGWGDLIYYFGDDRHTRSILIHMEAIGDARSFLSAAREVAREKPIVIIKAGRTEVAARAAASHTGALTGSDEVLDAAFRRCGVLRVNGIAELFQMADLLAKQPRPRGPRLTVVTNAGGPGVLATDALVAGGGELTQLSGETRARLNVFLPPHWSHNNPIDILGDADPQRYAQAVEVAVADAHTDGLLVILAPQGMTSPAETARQLVPHTRAHRIPILTCWMGGPAVAEGIAVLNQAGISTFSYPDEAARAFKYLWDYSENLRALQETPTLPGLPDPNRQLAEEVMRAVRAAGRSLLTEWESKQLLTAYCIPTVRTEMAHDGAQAAVLASEIGFPVVLKLHSETITHKTDVGGVKLNLNTAEAVRGAYEAVQQSVTERVGAQHFQGVTVQPMITRRGFELILGCSADAQFGPVLLFGAGGELVEIFQDRSLGLPPLNTTLARRMMERTRIYRALRGVRGQEPVDLGALEELLVRFSQLVVEQRAIKEIDINPLLASSEGLLALDARILLHPADVPLADLPAPAIRPYPSQHASTFETGKGVRLRIRPIRPEDEPLMIDFHQKLSNQTVYLRYLQFLGLEQRVAHERLTRICFIDYDREMVLVAEMDARSSQDGGVVGVGRLTKSHGRNDAEIAVLVRDDFQGQGLGKELLRRLLAIACDERLERVRAYILPVNQPMQKIARDAGFRFAPPNLDGLITAEINPLEIRSPTGAL
jgi:acetyltransferase